MPPRGREDGSRNRIDYPLDDFLVVQRARSGMLLRNQLYAGIVDVPEYGVRAKRGDFQALISEELFYR